MLILKKLKWSNMFSYGENNTLDLAAEPITQLVGLNGHGKSSIPLILEEVLFNKNSKGIKKGDIPNRELSTNKYSASLDFELNNQCYSIELNRSGAQQKVKLTQDGTDISSHTATDTFKHIEQLIGLDFKTFSQIVYQNSSSSLQFLTATDTARKNFLIDLLSLEEYVRIFEELKLLHKETNESLVKLQAQLGTVSAWLGRHKHMDTNPMLVVEVPSMDSPLFDSVANLKQQLAQVDALNLKIQKNNEYRRLLEQIKIEPLDVTPVDYSKEVQEAAVLKHKYESELATYKKYSAVKAGTCHTCYQPVNTETISRLTAEALESADSIRKEYTELLSKIKEAKAIEAKISAHEALIKDFEKYSSLVDASLPSMQQSKDDLAKSINQLEADLNALKQAHQDALDSNKRAEAHNAKIASTLEQIAQFESELAKLQPKVEEIEAQLILLDVLKKAFSTNGLLAYKIESSVKTLEALANEYLSELSDGRFLLNFQLNNDKLNVNIEDNGSLVSISALSAGELTRVTTATLLAIRKLMSSLSKSKINILFLDETIETLDSAGKEKLIEVLMQEHELNTFLVSHSYSHPLVSKVMVIKEEGISRLENG